MFRPLKSLDKLTGVLGVLFPSWKFFGDIADLPRLEYRSGTQGEWRDALPPLPRRVGELLINPRGTFLLAKHTAVERLIAELHRADQDSAGEVSRWPAYRIVEAIVAARVTGDFEFRVGVTDAAGENFREALRARTRAG